MGILYDSVEAEFGGHHYALRSTIGPWGLAVKCTLYVDGRQRDVQNAWLFGRAASLQATVGGELVTLTVKQRLTTRYRLFLGELEVPLHVEPGESSFSIDLQPPALAWARLTELPVLETEAQPVPSSRVRR